MEIEEESIRKLKEDMLTIASASWRGWSKGGRVDDKRRSLRRCDD